MIKNLARRSEHTENKAMEQPDPQRRRTSRGLTFADDMDPFVTGQGATSVEKVGLDRIRSLAAQSWLRRQSQAVSIETLLDQARWLRKSYEEQFRRDLDHVANLSPFNRGTTALPPFMPTEIGIS